MKRMILIVAGITVGANVSEKSIPSFWFEPTATNLPLWWIFLPLSSSLCMYTHFEDNTFIDSSLFTKNQVSILFNASSSSVIAFNHTGFMRAIFTPVGTTDSEDTYIKYFGLGLIIPLRILVTIGWFEISGGSTSIRTTISWFSLSIND